MDLKEIKPMKRRLVSVVLTEGILEEDEVGRDELLVVERRLAFTDFLIRR